jgi:hypothetical protein
MPPNSVGKLPCLCPSTMTLWRTIQSGYSNQEGLCSPCQQQTRDCFNWWAQTSPHWDHPSSTISILTPTTVQQHIPISTNSHTTHSGRIVGFPDRLTMWCVWFVVPVVCFVLEGEHCSNSLILLLSLVFMCTNLIIHSFYSPTFI